MSQVDIPSLGFGTWGIGGKSERDNSKSISQWAKSIEYFVELGGRHIDTAEGYGNGFAEEIVGHVLKQYSALRSEICLATKVSSENLSYNRVLQSAESSLNRLGVDYIDLYYIHAPNRLVPIEETMSALNELHSKGKIRSIGVSNFSKAALQAAMTCSMSPIAANQVHYNLIVREAAETGLVDFCQDQNISLVSWRPLQSKTSGEMNIQPLYSPGAYAVLDQMAAKYGASQAQIALAWLLTQKGVGALVKAEQRPHIDQMLEARSIVLEKDDYANLKTNFPIRLLKSDLRPLNECSPN